MNQSKRNLLNIQLRFPKEDVCVISSLMSQHLKVCHMCHLEAWIARYGNEKLARIIDDFQLDREILLSNFTVINENSSS